jgi:hypothetical protein
MPPTGHFCFEALPSLPEQGGKTKMKVSAANGIAWFKPLLRVHQR